MKILPNGVLIYNATPHDITFYDDSWRYCVVVESDSIINAVPKEEIVKLENNITYVKTIFLADTEIEDKLSQIKISNSNVIIIGSIIAAQAYPKYVVSMIPHPDFIRVAPKDKRMLPNKFNTFI